MHEVIEDDRIDGVIDEDWEVRNESIANTKFPRKDPIMTNIEEQQHQFKINQRVTMKSQIQIQTQHNEETQVSVFME